VSDSITEALIQGYKEGFLTLFQQEGSQLRPYMRVENQSAKADFYDRIGSTTVAQRTVRHGDSPYIPTPHTRRMNVMQDFHWGDFIDDQDKIRTLNDPTNEYVRAGAMAMGRKIDTLILSGLTGSAWGGETGTTEHTYASEALTTIPHTSTGLTFVKLRLIKAAFGNADVPQTARIVIACTATQISDLMGETELTSADYQQVKALINGEMTTAFGFTFVQVSPSFLTKVSTERDCIAFVAGHNVLGMGIEPEGHIERRADKGFSTYVYMAMSAGATRLEGPSVVTVECTE